MLRVTTSRATIAGIGSTAALLAAVIAVSLIVGGLVAYTASPSGPLATSEPALALPLRATPDEAQRQAALVLPPDAQAVAPAATTSAAGAGDGGPGTTPATPANASEGTGATGSSGLAAPAVADPVATLPTDPPRPVDPSPTDTLGTVGGTLGGTLNETIGGISDAIATLTPRLGVVVTTAGAGLGTAVTSADGVGKVVGAAP